MRKLINIVICFKYYELDINKLNRHELDVMGWLFCKAVYALSGWLVHLCLGGWSASGYHCLNGNEFNF